jgi:hypothetical protein
MKRLISILCCVIFVALISQVAVTSYTILAGVDTTKPDSAVFAQLFERQLAIRAMQISAGYGLGLICLMIGIFSCWQGVNGQIEVSGGSDKFNFNIKTAQVGAVIVLAGVVLIGLAIRSPNSKIVLPGGWQAEGNVVPDYQAIPRIEL